MRKTGDAEKCGIYAIRNKLNGVCYYGSTSNWRDRKINHHNDLLKNKHHCQHLQNAWNKYGEDTFEFIWLLDVPEPQLLDIEQTYLDLPEKKYNIGKVAGAAWRGRKHTEESKAKMREKRKLQIISEDTKKKISNTLKGIILPEETKHKISKALKGRVVSEDFRKQLRGKGYSYCPSKKTWLVTIYEHKKCFRKSCKTEDEAKSVVELARNQIDNGLPISVNHLISKTNRKCYGKGYFYNDKRDCFQLSVRHNGTRLSKRVKTEDEAKQLVCKFRKQAGII